MRRVSRQSNRRRWQASWFRQGSWRSQSVGGDQEAGAHSAIAKREAARARIDDRWVPTPDGGNESSRSYQGPSSYAITTGAQGEPPQKRKWSQPHRWTTRIENRGIQTKSRTWRSSKIGQERNRTAPRTAWSNTKANRSSATRKSKENGRTGESPPDEDLGRRRTSQAEEREDINGLQRKCSRN